MYRRLTRPFTALCAALIAGVLVSACQSSLPGSGAAQSTLLQSASRRLMPASPVSPSAPARLRSGVAVPSWMRFRPMTGTGRVYVSEFNYTNVNEYAARNKKNAPPLCQIPNQTFVNGIGVDSSLNLWAPNAYPTGLGFTAIFAPNCGKMLSQIADKDGQPAGVAF